MPPFPIFARVTLCTLLLAAAALQEAIGQIPFQSIHMAEPERLIGYVDSTASFWLDSYDDARGGFYTNVARDGSVITAWGTNKNMLTQTRNAYAMVRAFQMTGDEAYLTYARGALDFMYAHAWDQTNGGWYSNLSETGQVQGANNNKSAFDQHYALLGPLAMYEATGTATDWAWVQQGLAHNEAKLWDTRSGMEGYYDYTNASGSFADGKSFNATVDAMTTHALQLYHLTQDDAYLTRLGELAANIQDHLVASMPNQAIGFAEKYDANWQVQSNETLTIMGHVLKTSWVLSRLYEIDPQPSYLQDAALLMNHVLDKGYDHVNGGPFKDYNRLTGEMQLWGIPHQAKAWWQMQQAVMAGLELYRHTENKTYLEIADETLAFFMRHFVDKTYGEVFENRTETGAFISQWGDHKGGGFKAGYHSVELGYYTYIYSHSYVHREPFTLHYKFDPVPEARTLRLSPVAAADLHRMQIMDVQKDGAFYIDYDSETRTLTIPPNVGGHFEVTFEAVFPVATEPVLPAPSFALEAAYPNPFTSHTTLTYTLDQSAPIRLAVYDLLGREVALLATGVQPAGQHRTTWDGTTASGRTATGGMYLIVLEAAGQRQVQKVVRLP